MPENIFRNYILWKQPLPEKIFLAYQKERGLENKKVGYLPVYYRLQIQFHKEVNGFT